MTIEITRSVQVIASGEVNTKANVTMYVQYNREAYAKGLNTRMLRISGESTEAVLNTIIELHNVLTDMRRQLLAESQ